MRCLLALALLLSACPAPTQYAIDRPGLDCDRATRVANKTFEAMGYTVTGLVQATPNSSGMVSGTKVGPDGKARSGRVVIRCTAQGADLQPVEEGLLPGDFEFSRAFGYSFKTLVQRPDVETPWKSVGLQVLVEQIGTFKAKLDLGDVATVGGAVPVRVTVRNNTDRKVRLDAPRLSLVDADGTSRQPLAGGALDAAIAGNAAGSKLRAELFGPKPIAAQQSAVGFLVYPPGTYREARVSIEDVETEESEGFVVPVE
ncbi:MAG TPA: hypothetical protein VMS22_03770 [Candidatus Eisenbacteria bacterium]|nr:hypothetical protein [Candidatus Eisenbacteria bacterium]